jgi:hypothetical protein
MPDSLLSQPAAKVGTGTYQTGTAPQTAAQKSGDLRQAAKSRSNLAARQKVKSYAPGQDPRIKGRTSFSDEMGD